ncbi:Ribonucleases P/MRP protein subunit pop1 [Cryptotrichosporon argae]
MSSSSSKAGPSKPAPSSSFKPKVIHKTVDMLRRNERAKAGGKGKENEVLGGVADLLAASRDLPGAIQVERFAEARALEILALQNAMKLAASQANTRAFQSLPRHLRRRAASHNPRRVPKRLRGRAAAEIDPSDPTVRRHRKKAKLLRRGNLRGESRTAQLRKRQRSKAWLATHLFHAKRFHMADLWGYRLPVTPTLKSFRPSYRAARRKATVADVSYFRTLWVEGDRGGVVAVLSNVCAGTFAGKQYENGRLARVLLYHPDTFPRGLIGPADVIWTPSLPASSSQAGSVRVLLRVHPSILAETAAALDTAVAQTPPSAHAVHTGALVDDMAAFEIMGPLAGRTIRRVLRAAGDMGTVKKDAWRMLEGDAADGTIMGFKVHDPRLSFPPARVEPTEPVTSAGVLRTALIEPSAKLASSALWDDAARRAAVPAFCKAGLDHRRRELGVPGTRLRPLAQDDRLDIVLVRRHLPHAAARADADPTADGFSGFTLLVPRSWAQPLLVSLVYARAYHVGLEERRVQHREAGTASFPEHYGAVCAAGRQWEDERGKERARRWVRRPPGRRVEWESVGTWAPFVPDWTFGRQPTEEDAMNGPLRAREPWLLTDPLLAFLPALLRAPAPSTLLRMLNAYRAQRGASFVLADHAHALWDDAVVHVDVECVGRGRMGDLAVIYRLGADERAEWARAEGEAGWGAREHAQKLAQRKAVQADAIGYVLSANYSVSRGRGHGLGTLTLAAWVDLAAQSQGAGVGGSAGGDVDVWVKVRNPDGTMCRLARARAIA